MSPRCTVATIIISPSPVLKVWPVRCAPPSRSIRGRRARCLQPRAGSATKLRSVKRELQGIAQQVTLKDTVNVHLYRPSTAARLRRGRGRTLSLCLCPRRLLVVGFPAHAVLDAAAPPMAGAGGLCPDFGGGRCRLACARRLGIYNGVGWAVDLAPCWA